MVWEPLEIFYYSRQKPEIKIWVILKMGADTFLLFKMKNRYENIGHIENGYVSYTGCVA